MFVEFQLNTGVKVLINTDKIKMIEGDRVYLEQEVLYLMDKKDTKKKLKKVIEDDNPEA